MQKTQLTFLLLIGFFGGCANNEVAEPELCDLPPAYVTLREYNKAEGFIYKFNSFPGQHPDSYGIVITSCADCPYVRDIPDGLINLGIIPCNLPDRFKKDSLSISFSGAAKIDTGADYRVIDITGIPFELSSIRRKPLKAE